MPRKKMNKIFAVIVFHLFAVLISSGQTRERYAFDNFDTSRGVQIVKSTPAPNNTPSSKVKLVRKTGQQSMRMSEAVSIKDVNSAISFPQVRMGKGSGLAGFTTGDSLIDSYVVDSSSRYGIDPLLIYSQMHQESSFQLKATSNKGARGLMQLMPATARRFGVSNIYDPQQNIDAGVRYMRWLLDTFEGDVSLALAGYNAGEGAVWKYGNSIPPYDETRNYVSRILNKYQTIRNPNTAKGATRVTLAQVQKFDKKGSASTKLYERNTITVRLPDGRLRLVNE